jgi:hypothetical protein
MISSNGSIRSGGFRMQTTQRLIRDLRSPALSVCGTGLKDKSANFFCRDQGCQIALATTYQNWKKYTK